jgi:hypothetical protein
LHWVGFIASHAPCMLPAWEESCIEREFREFDVADMFVGMLATGYTFHPLERRKETQFT